MNIRIQEIKFLLITIALFTVWGRCSFRAIGFIFISVIWLQILEGLRKMIERVKSGLIIVYRLYNRRLAYFGALGLHNLAFELELLFELKLMIIGFRFLFDGTCYLFHFWLFLLNKDSMLEHLFFFIDNAPIFVI